MPKDTKEYVDSEADSSEDDDDDESTSSVEGADDISAAENLLKLSDANPKASEGLLSNEANPSSETLEVEQPSGTDTNNDTAPSQGMF